MRAAIRGSKVSRVCCMRVLRLFLFFITKRHTYTHTHSQATVDTHTHTRCTEYTTRLHHTYIRRKSFSLERKLKSQFLFDGILSKTMCDTHTSSNCLFMNCWQFLLGWNFCSVLLPTPKLRENPGNLRICCELCDVRGPATNTSIMLSHCYH